MVNEKDEPLIGASVVFKKHNSSNIVSYSIVNKDGQYDLSIDEKDSIKIEVSYIGYKKIIKSIFWFSTRNQF